MVEYHSLSLWGGDLYLPRYQYLLAESRFFIFVFILYLFISYFLSRTKQLYTIVLWAVEMYTSNHGYIDGKENKNVRKFSFVLSLLY
jgi:hypothetical protein